MAPIVRFPAHVLPVFVTRVAGIAFERTVQRDNLDPTVHLLAFARTEQFVIRSTGLAFAPKASTVPLALKVSGLLNYWEIPLHHTECPPGRFGRDCMRVCECQNGASCDPKDGHCICPPGGEKSKKLYFSIYSGFHGPQCERLCPKGTFGANCLQMCDCELAADNWQGNGTHHLEYRLEGGGQGGEEALVHLEAADCDPVDGECICPPGLHGKRCEESGFLQCD